MRWRKETFLQFQRCSRENQLWFRENQRWNSSDSALIFFALKISIFKAVSEKISAVFELWNLGFSALFRAESALLIDFQVMNSAEADLKFFWIRADQRWLSLRRQPWFNGSLKRRTGLTHTWVNFSQAETSLKFALHRGGGGGGGT